MRARFATSRGFSLLELLVAFVIMALALGMIYRAVGSAVSNVSTVEGRQRAFWVADSVLSQIDGVPEQGVTQEGQAQEFRWALRTAPYEGGVVAPQAPRLHEVLVVVQWDEAGQSRQIEFTALRPQKRTPAPRGGA